MYMQIDDHGGECCGRKHLWEVGSCGPYHDRVEKLKELLDEGYYNHTDTWVLYRQTCVEITCTHEQWTKETDTRYGGGYHALGKTWKEVLPRLGFKRVHSFINPNSGNLVHVLLRSEIEVDEKDFPEDGKCAPTGPQFVHDMEYDPDEDDEDY